MSRYLNNYQGEEIKSITLNVTGDVKEIDQAKMEHLVFDHATAFQKESKIVYVPLKTSIDNSKNNDNGEKQYKHSSNSFIHSCVLAYNQHHNLVIRPDDVWIAIMTQFSFYLNANSETLRSKIVDHDGKKDLEVVSSGTLFNAPYDEMTMSMIDLIAGNIRDPSVREWAIPNFSTTSNVDRIVGAVCLMATMKNYFNYKYSLRCGLPSVTMLGSVEDWKLIKERAQRLTEFDTDQKLMTIWLASLNPVLDRFIQTVEGNGDAQWWNRIASHVGGGSGPTWISGWVTVFNYFSTEGKWFGDKKKKTSIAGEFVTEWALIDIQDISNGYAELDVKIDVNGTIYDAKLFSGHYTFKVFDKDTMVPQLNWCMMVNQEEHGKFQNL